MGLEAFKDALGGSTVVQSFREHTPHRLVVGSWNPDALRLEVGLFLGLRAGSMLQHVNEVRLDWSHILGEKHAVSVASFG